MRHGRRGGYGALLAGVILITLGTGFLLRNAGLIELDWSLIWPVALIAVGAVVIVGATGRARGGSGERHVVVPAEGAARLELTLRLGAGDYRLAGGAASGLVEATADDDSIALGAARAGDLARVRLSTAFDAWGWGWSRGHRWQIAVAPAVPTVLDMQAGAGTFHVDLSAVATRSAAFSIGAADLTVVLPRPTGEVPIRVEGGAASFTFQVPAGVEARVAVAGLVSTSGPRETGGYAAAADRVTVTVTGGAAAVRIVPVA